MGSLW